MRYRDREHAGRVLGQQLGSYAWRGYLLVLGLAAVSAAAAENAELGAAEREWRK